MKNIISILLALLILLQSSSKAWIIISFKINQDYIAKSLCINRDNPELLCRGKCYLKKQIKAEEEKEKNGTPQKLKEYKEVLYCLDDLSWQIERPKDWADRTKNTFRYQTPFTSTFVKGIFRPPKLITVSSVLG